MENEAFAQLEKLASEAIARVGELEAENAELKASFSKQAVAEVKPSDEAIEKALEGLLKSGSLLPEQIEPTRQCFKSDPDAAFRAITGLTLDACPQVKTATNDDLSGGTLKDSASYEDYRESMYSRMEAILNR